MVVGLAVMVKAVTWNRIDAVVCDNVPRDRLHHYREPNHHYLHSTQHRDLHDNC